MLNIFAGKLSRKQFLIRFITTIVSFIVIAVILNTLAKDTVVYQGPYYVLVLLSVVLVLYIYQLSLYVRRLRDLGQSVFLVLISLIPFINLLFLLYLLFAPSKKK